MENPLSTTELPRPEDLGDQDDDKKGRLILVAEDSPDSAIPISLHLQQMGYQVVMANDGEEAVKVAALSRPHLILMDLAMPVLDGLGATKRIREESPSPYIPIIAITAFSTSGFLQAA